MHETGASLGLIQQEGRDFAGGCVQKGHRGEAAKHLIARGAHLGGCRFQGLSFWFNICGLN